MVKETAASPAGGGTPGAGEPRQLDKWAAQFKAELAKTLKEEHEKFMAEVNATCAQLMGKQEEQATASTQRAKQLKAQHAMALEARARLVTLSLAYGPQRSHSSIAGL